MLTKGTVRTMWSTAALIFASWGSFFAFSNPDSAWLPFTVMVCGTSGWLAVVAVLLWRHWYGRRVAALRAAQDDCAGCRMSGSVWESPRGDVLVLCAKHVSQAPWSRRWRLADIVLWGKGVDGF